MRRLELPRLSGYYILPLLVSIDTFSILAQRALVDYGATKCVIPKIVNDKTLHLPIIGTDKDVETGNGKRDFQYVILPRVIIVEINFAGKTFQIKETGLEVRDVPAWLGDEEEEFVAGLSFLDKFNITMKKGEMIVVET